LFNSPKGRNKIRKHHEPSKLDDGVEFTFADLKVKIEEPIINPLKQEQLLNFMEEKEYDEIYVIFIYFILKRCILFVFFTVKYLK
jgi:hypothetical protein